MSATHVKARRIFSALVVFSAFSPHQAMARVEKLLEPVAFPVALEGRKAGETRVKAGTEVTVLEEKSGRVLIKFGALEPQWVPVSAIRRSIDLGGGPFTWAWAVPPRYSKALPFDATGWARVRLGAKWGLIDRDGKEVLPCQYDEVITYPDHNCASFRSGDKWGLIDSRGAVLLKPEWEDVQPLIRGFIPVKRDGKWGYADEQGRIVIEPAWDNAWRFSPVGTAVVTVGTDPESRKRGFIDKTGKVITPVVWDGAINHVAEGVGAVRRGNGWTLVDETGKVLGEPQWQMIWKSLRPDLGMLPVRKDGKWGIIGLDAAVRVSPEYDGFAVGQTGILLFKKPAKTSGNAPPAEAPATVFSGTPETASRRVQQLLAKRAPEPPAAKGETAVFVGKDGKILHRVEAFEEYGNARFMAADDFLEFSEGFLPVRSGDKWGFIDEKGKTVIAPAWDEVGNFQEGLVAVKNKDDEDGWQFLKADGTAAFPRLEGVQFGYPWRAPFFRDGVVRGEKEGGSPVLITREGRIAGAARDNMWLPKGVEIAGTDFDHVSRHGRYGYMRNFAGNDGEIAVRDVPVEIDSLDDPFPYAGPPRYGLASIDGKMLVEPSWDLATLMPGGWVRVWKEDRAGLANASGRQILKPEWDAVELAGNGLLLATKNGRVSVFSQDGKPLLPAGLKKAEYVDFYGEGFIVRSEKSDGSTLWSLCGPKSAAPVDLDAAARVYWNQDLAKNGLLWIEQRDAGQWSLIKSDGTPLGITQELQPSRWFMAEGFGILTKSDETKIHLAADGKTLGTTAWDEAGLFSHGFAPVKTGGKWGFLDKEGNMAVPPEWDEAAGFQNVGTQDSPVLLARVAREGRWGCLDRSGRIVVEPSWDEMGPFSPVGDGRFVAFVRRGSLWGCIDQSGKRIIAPCGMDRGLVESGAIRLTVKERNSPYGRYVYYDTNGARLAGANPEGKGGKDPDLLAAGMQITRSPDGKFGLNDADGKAVLEQKWDHIAWIGPRVVAAWTENEGGIFDATGRALFRDDSKRRIARFDRPGREQTPGRYQQGVVVIEQTPLWGYAKLAPKEK